MTRILMRRGTAAQWATANPVLAVGEPGFETDTRIFKVGDGATTWTNLVTNVTVNLADTSQWINAADHGITPTASTPAALLQALSAANPGRVIFIPAGDYTMETQVRLYGPVIGEGYKSNLIFPELPGAALRWLSGSDGYAFARDLRVTSTSTEDWQSPSGSAISTTSSHGIIVDTITGFHLDNVTVSGRFRMGIHVRNSHRGTVSDCTVVNTAYDGIHFENGCTDVTAFGNHCVDTGDDGIAVISTGTDPAQNERVTVTGNTVKNVRHARGLVCEGGKDCSFVGNVVQQTASRNVLINSIGSSQSDTWGTVNCLVADNVLTGAGLQGITVSGKTSEVTIRGNLVDAAAGIGIQLLVAAGVVVEGNTVSDNGAGNGIEVPANVLNVGNIIRGNTVRRSATRGIYNEGVGTVIVDNVIDHPGQVANANGITTFNPTRVGVRGNRVYGTDSTKTPIGVEFSGTSTTPGRCLDNYVTWDTGSGTEVYVAATVTGLLRANNGPVDQSAPLVVTVASSATPVPQFASSESHYLQTALAANATFGAPVGAALNVPLLIVRIKDDGTPRTLAWNSVYRAVGATLPTTTVASKVMYLTFRGNYDEGKWDLLSVLQQP